MAVADPKRDIAVYHCQQAAEKAFKAVLIERRSAFPKTHDLEALISCLASDGVDASKFAEHAMTLNPYAVEFRYPGDVLEPEEDDAQEALGMASEVVEWAETWIRA